jgi:hypothetical protein
MVDKMGTTGIKWISWGSYIISPSMLMFWIDGKQVYKKHFTIKKTILEAPFFCTERAGLAALRATILSSLCQTSGKSSGIDKDDKKGFALYLRGQKIDEETYIWVIF